MEDKLTELYINTFGQSPSSISKLSGAGSNRQYFRYIDKQGNSAIGVFGEDCGENHSFTSLCQQMNDKGLNVPAMVSKSEDEHYYFQEDLGNVSLYDHISQCLKTGIFDDNTKALLHKVLSDLPDIQFKTAEGYDFNNCYREKEFSPLNIRWDLNYFKYCFLKLTRITFDEIKLEEEFEQIVNNIMSMEECKLNTFLYRDFQSRNVMVKDNTPYYIDFQGGYRGPFFYDVASFLWQARAAYPEGLRNELLDTYLKSLQKYYAIDKETFNTKLSHFVFFRMLQVLGAYGYRGLFEHKTMFITPIAKALQNALSLELYPYISILLKQISELDQFQPHSATGELTVRITSFSFKKGIPEDYSGNGGGFVFDCRAPENPGRYDEYKKLTGIDRPVIDFIESRSKMPQFMENVYNLVDPAVETYLRRGFTSLMVSFGCTGGQHRSVYGAEHLAAHIADKYPKAHIILTHREQNIIRKIN